MTTRTSLAVTDGKQPKGLRVGLVAQTATYSVGAGLSLSAGDVIQMVKVPKDAQVIYIAVSGGSGNAVVACGDGGDPDRYLAHTTMLSGGNILTPSTHAQNAGYTYSVDDTIDLDVSTVTLGTITGGFHMKVIYALDAAP